MDRPTLVGSADFIPTEHVIPLRVTVPPDLKSLLHYRVRKKMANYLNWLREAAGGAAEKKAEFLAPNQYV